VVHNTLSFSGAGLALDVIGAVLVTLGLFRHPMPLYPGWSRLPTAAAEDRAYGTTGGSFFVCGFVGQLLSSAGYASHDRTSVFASAGITLAAGALVAYVVFGLSYIGWMRYTMRYVMREIATKPNHEGYDTPWRRSRKGLKFWHYDPQTSP
jgi:hypothetical protein